MAEATTNLITVVDETVSGEGAVVETRSISVRQANTTFPAASDTARFYLNVTALTAGAAPTLDVDIVHEYLTNDYVIGSFTQAAEGTSFETITLDAVPTDLKVVYTVGGTATDVDFTVDITRF